MNEKENKMGVMPVGKLLVSMSLPMMASMLVLALFGGMLIYLGIDRAAREMMERKLFF